MIETLNNLRNNRVKADPGSTGPGSALATEEGMRKFLNGIAKKRGGMSLRFHKRYPVHQCHRIPT